MIKETRRPLYRHRQIHRHTPCTYNPPIGPMINLLRLQLGLPLSAISDKDRVCQTHFCCWLWHWVLAPVQSTYNLLPDRRVLLPLSAVEYGSLAMKYGDSDAAIRPDEIFGGDFHIIRVSLLLLLFLMSSFFNCFLVSFIFFIFFFLRFLFALSFS